MTRTMLIAGASAVGILAVGGTTAAFAAGSDTSSSSSSTAQSHTALGAKRLNRLCDREPARAKRTGKLIARLSGDASTRGSVAWLNARAAKLQSTDPGLAKLVTDEANVRQSQLATLKLRQTTQADTVTYCASKGHPVGN